MDKRISVIGNGVLSLSVAAQMAVRGGQVTYIDLSGKLPEGDCVPLKVSGVMEYRTQLDQVCHSFDSVNDAEIVAVTVTGSSHEEVFDHLVPRIRDGQMVVFFPACFGALRLLKRLRGLEKRITLCEAVSFPCVCEGREPFGLYVQGVKNSLRMAVHPTEDTQQAIALLNRYFDLFQPAQNLYETSLDNMNMTLHPLPVLLNAARAEREPENFRHYIDGISPAVGQLMEALDKERMAIGRALGLKLTSARDQLVEYYGERGLDTMWEYASSPRGPYPEVKGFGLRSRYVEEDVPYLLVPAAGLAERCGVPTPVMDLCIRLASMLMGTDYEKTGCSIEKPESDGN